MPLVESAFIQLLGCSRLSGSPSQWTSSIGEQQELGTDRPRTAQHTNRAPGRLLGRGGSPHIARLNVREPYRKRTITERSESEASGKWRPHIMYPLRVHWENAIL